jgi:hypothetical protein
MKAATIVLLAALRAGSAAADPPPFGPGESIALRITYAGVLAGRARLTVSAAARDDRPVLELAATAQSEGFFAWLFHFRVRDRTVAEWDPASGCSVRIEKALREGRAVRDQEVVFDPVGSATVHDPKIRETRFDVEPCSLDILSALFVTRQRGVTEDHPLDLPVFDNGRKFRMSVKLVGRERLDLPAPLGEKTPTIVVEPHLVEGTGLFVKEKDARLKIWLTDDARRIPVRMRSKVAIGAVSADIEAYTPPGGDEAEKARDQMPRGR